MLLYPPPPTPQNPVLPDDQTGFPLPVTQDFMNILLKYFCVKSFNFS